MNELLTPHRSRLMRPGLIATVLLLVTACAGTAPETVPDETADTETAAAEIEQQAPKVEPRPEDYPVKPFTGDSLFHLLVGEVAGYRSEYDTALEYYLAAARETQDPAVAERATRLALYLKNDSSALVTARIWAQTAPEDIDAHRHLADLLLRSGDLETAIKHMEAVKKLGGLAKFDVFAYRASNLSDEQQVSLLDVISEMLDRYPGDEELMFSKAVLLELTGQLQAALELSEQLLQISPNVNVIILKMSVLSSLGRDEQALTFMQEKVAELPDNRRLRLILARLQFEAGNLAAARKQYETVLIDNPDDADVLFALALIELEQKDDAGAKAYFERMVRWNLRTGEAHYYLGGIAERQGDPQRALAEYRQAGNGYEFLPAQSRIAAILFSDGRVQEAREHIDRMIQQYPGRARQLYMIEAQLLTERGFNAEALTLLDEVIKENPEDIEMLYFRAMTGQQMGRLDILEADLRRIIELDPDNADALNALGYTLTDQTDRHEEAMELIQRALDIKPDEAAFIDSLGWVHYRLNNYEEAVVHLRRALEMFQNDEVAAHLGEVLWMMGAEDEANEVWNRALEWAPGSEILKEVIQRLRGQ